MGSGKNGLHTAKMRSKCA